MKLIKKLFSFSIGSVAAVIIGVISTPIITRVINPTEYGIATIFMTFGSLISIVSLAGLDQAFVRFFYESNRISLLKKCLSISIIIASFLALLLIIFDQQFSSNISSGSSYALLMILYVIATLIFRYSSLLLRMLQFGYRYSLVQVLQKLFDLVFVLSIAFFFMPNRYALILGSILTLLAISVVTLLFSVSFWKDKNIIILEKSYKEILVYSMPLLLATFMSILFQTLDKLILSAWVSSEEFGVYSAGFKLIAILNIIQTSFTLFWTPVSLEHYKKYPEDREFYGQMSKIITVTMVAVSILVVMFKDILVLFLGPEYREASSVIAMLVLMPVMYTMSETTVQGVNFALKSHVHVIISLITLIVNIIFCFVLIPQLGMKGAAISVGLSYVVFYLVRTYYGLKNYYFDNKFKRTLLLLTVLVSWMITVIVTDSQVTTITGGVSLLILLFFLFKKEIHESSIFLKNLLLKK